MAFLGSISNFEFLARACTLRPTPLVCQSDDTNSVVGTAETASIVARCDGLPRAKLSVDLADCREVGIRLALSQDARVVPSSKVCLPYLSFKAPGLRRHGPQVSSHARGNSSGPLCISSRATRQWQHLLIWAVWRACSHLAEFCTRRSILFSIFPDEVRLSGR
jgi:hypothetical protein